MTVHYIFYYKYIICWFSDDSCVTQFIFARNPVELHLVWSTVSVLISTCFNSSSSMPSKSIKKTKYPAIKFSYEADRIPGLYFAGTVAHSLDYRKSAGGFIHGFRYTGTRYFLGWSRDSHTCCILGRFMVYENVFCQIIA